MNKFIPFVFFLFLASVASAQLKVSITIDDVPNTVKYKKDNFHPALLHTLDSLKIPVTIFINEGNIYKTEFPSRNFELLDNWAKREYITLGNHTFSHAPASELTLDSFETEITRGEAITRELAKVNKKTLAHFRFPYNNLGKDSISQWQLDSFLRRKKYDIAPFTIESSDFIFADLYDHYLGEGQRTEALKIADQYIEYTILIFDYLDSLVKAQYGRRVNQIYLCHDNSLNAEYLPILVEKLKVKGYSFISFEDALKDDIYKQRNYYHKKWGISWLYRWMPDDKERKKAMQQEPELKGVIEAYNQLKEEKKK